MWDLSEIEQFFFYNPPLHELVGDWLEARKRYEPDAPQPIPQTTERLGTREELESFANEWRT